MKKTLLLLSITMSFLGFSQTFDNIPTGVGFYINKAIPSPNGNDLTNEYFEFRGAPNAVIPSDLYFVMIEGDGESGKTDMGRVKEAIQLGDGTRTFGANGIVALVANYTDSGTGVVTSNNYTPIISANASIITIELTGTDVTSSSSSAVDMEVPDIGYDGNFTDQSATYMLISATSNPKNVEIDVNLDGVIDATGTHTTDWVLYDSISLLDYDDPDNGSDQGEFGYGQFIVARSFTGNETDFKLTTSATVIDGGTSNPTYAFRQGVNTGATVNDWVVASNGSGSASPNWIFSGVASKVSPDEFVNYQMPDSIFGELNPTAASLSEESFELSNVVIYPNPAISTFSINSDQLDQITKAELFNVLGKRVLVKENWSNNRIDVTDLQSGIYFLKIHANAQSITKKLMIK